MRYAAFVVVLIIVSSAGPSPGPTSADSSDWGWPLTGRPLVIRRFDPPARPWLAGHRGVDLASRPDQWVLATGAGTIAHAGRVAGRGVVTIDHPGGLRTTYLPVHPSVRPGQTVDLGDRIGTVEDNYVHCLAACLHWGLLRGDLYLDPLLLLGRGQVRLLPRWTDSAVPSGLRGLEMPCVIPGSGRGCEPGAGVPARERACPDFVAS